MKNLGQELKTMMPTNFLERQKAIVERFESHEEVLRIKQEYNERTSNLTHPISFGDLSQHLTYFDNCKKCQGLSNCQNEQRGHSSVVDKHPSKSEELIFRLRKCPLMVSYEKQKVISSLIKSHHVPESILNASFEDIEPDPQRSAAILAAINFCSNFKKGTTTIGLYLYGPMGVGKSRIAGAIAQELAKRGVDVLMVYVPDFLSEVKDAIGSNSVGSKLDALRETTVLILDDIGAETLTSWTRDEVIGPILQRRMERLPIIYTSNLTIREFRQQLVGVKDARIEDRKQHEKKADRIIERIEPFVKVYPVGGRNWRRG